MQIELKLFASLRKHLAKPVNKITVNDTLTVTVGRLLEQQGIPLEEAPVILVNGVRAGQDCVLKDGDTVSLFPLIGGG
ncbi:MAG: MoaD/ThiS family protein [Eubacteriales bacterium]